MEIEQSDIPGRSVFSFRPKEPERARDDFGGAQHAIPNDLCMYKHKAQSLQYPSLHRHY
jgi:hypothetical protein